MLQPSQVLDSYGPKAFRRHPSANFSLSHPIPRKNKAKRGQSTNLDSFPTYDPNGGQPFNAASARLMAQLHRCRPDAGKAKKGSVNKS